MPKRKPAAHESRPPDPPDDPQVDSPDENPESAITESEDTRDIASLDNVLSDYIAQENLDDTNYRASLYQFDKVNRNKQHLLDVTIGAILSPHDVGMAYGSGEYRYVVTWPKAIGPDNKPRIKAFRFNIGQSYDVKRALSGASPAPGGTQAPAPASPAADPVAQALQLVGALVQLQALNKPAAPPPPADPVLQMTQQHAAMQQILQQSSLQYIEFMKETRRRFLDLDNPEPYEEEEGDDMEDRDELVEQMKKLAVEYLPKILGDGLGGKATVAAVRSLPQFKRVVKDGPTLAHLLTELEKEVGKDKVDAACVRLKIKRPE